MRLYVLLVGITMGSFFGCLQAHTVIVDPDPMILPFGGPDGTISIVLVGDEPSPKCQVSVSVADPHALVSVTAAGPQPAPEVVLTVHALRQPQGQSEFVDVSGTWVSAGIPSPPCLKGVRGPIRARVTVTRNEPVVNEVINGASLLPGIQTGSWATIRGTGLANSSRTWNAETEIINGKLPTSLDGVSVTINGEAAVVYYISPSQLNILPANDSAVGPVEVRVAVGNSMSNLATSQLQKYSPAFFMFGPQGSKYIVAQIARSDGGVDLLGPPSLFGGTATTRPAKPGEVIILYGTGFGPTDPPVPSGEVFTGAAPTADPVVVTIGGVDARVQFAGISGAGLYQLNVVVPALGDGDQKVVARVGGLNSQDNAFIAVKN